MPDQSIPPDQPDYGSHAHYLDEAGHAYYASYQAPLGDMAAKYNRHLWTPYIDSRHDVLDFGCGGGALLSSLDAQRKVGVEINPHARSVAQDRGLETYTALHEVSGKFDRLMSSHALEHIPFPQKALAELRTLFRGPESRLILLLPLDDWRNRTNRTFDPRDINQHLYAWTPQTLGNLLTSAGYSVDEIRVVNHAWHPRFGRLWDVSVPFFHQAARLFSMLKRSRQLLAVASIK